MRYFKHWILVAAGSALLAAATAQAERPYGMAGCGLGAIIFKPEGSQTSAATSNAIGYQTLAITSGTSKCIPKDKWAKLVDQENFVVANYSTLSKEMAQGDGLALAALTEKLGCNNAIYPELTAHFRDQYGEIFRAPGAIAMLHKTLDTINDNPRLADACAHTRF